MLTVMWHVLMLSSTFAGVGVIIWQIILLESAACIMEPHMSASTPTSNLMSGVAIGSELQGVGSTCNCTSKATAKAARPKDIMQVILPTGEAPGSSTAVTDKLASRYVSIYKEQMNKPPEHRKYVHFSFGNEAGWGNRLMATFKYFELALATGRIFVVNHQMFE